MRLSTFIKEFYDGDDDDVGVCMSGGGESSNDDFLARHHVDQWWNKLLKDEDKTCLEHSGKLVLLFDILTLAQQLGDKVLVHFIAFSDLL